MFVSLVVSLKQNMLCSSLKQADAVLNISVRSVPFVKLILTLMVLLIIKKKSNDTRCTKELKGRNKDFDVQETLTWVGPGIGWGRGRVVRRRRGKDEAAWRAGSRSCGAKAADQLRLLFAGADCVPQCSHPHDGRCIPTHTALSTPVQLNSIPVSSGPPLTRTSGPRDAASQAILQLRLCERRHRHSLSER